MDGIIIFSSKYGSTARYASWIGQTCQVPVTDVEHGPEDLSKFNYLIIGSAVYAGKLLMAKWIKKYERQIANKKLFIFIVGGTPCEETEKIEKILQNNIPAPIRLTAELYYLDGELNIGRLSFADRLRLKAAAYLTRDTNERAMLQKGFDRVKFTRLRGIVRSVCTFSGHQVNPEPAALLFEERLN